MAEAKTQPTGASVPAFISALSDARQRADCRALVQLMTRATGAPPVLWGRNIVGFGRYRYRYASGTTGAWPLTAFAPRGTALTIYFMDGFDAHAAALARLGSHKHAKACLYVKSLDGLDRAVLAAMVTQSVRAIRARWPAEGAAEEDRSSTETNAQSHARTAPAPGRPGSAHAAVAAVAKAGRGAARVTTVAPKVDKAPAIRTVTAAPPGLARPAVRAATATRRSTGSRPR